MKANVLKILAKIENIKVPTLWGYSLAVFMFGFFLVLRVAQLEVKYGGGEDIILWSHFSIFLSWASIVLFALTKKTKRFGLKLARVFAILFAFLSDCVMPYVRIKMRPFSCANLEIISDILFLMCGLLGYFIGRNIGKKAEKFSSSKFGECFFNKSKENSFFKKFKSFLWCFFYKIENLNIKAFVGYSLAVLLLVSSFVDFLWPDIGRYTYKYIFDFICIRLAIILFALTKKTKRFGLRLARLFAIFSFFAVLQLSQIIPSWAGMYGDCYIDPMDAVMFSISVIAGFLGYLLGQRIGQKIKN